MKIFSREEATSESIGTILTVAVTVTIAAIIAVFVFGMAGNVENAHVIGISAKSDQETESVSITYHGGPDHDKLGHLNWTVSNSEGASTTGSVVTPEVGFVETIDASSNWKPPYRVLVTAWFNDDTTWVMYDKEV